MVNRIAAILAQSAAEDDPNMAPADRMWVQAQRIIQAAFYSYGNAETKPGTLTLSSADLERVIKVALAMLLAADSRIVTRQHIRRTAEAAAKDIRTYVEMMRDGGDTTGAQIMEFLGITQSSMN